ncbi:protocadherin gamma-C5-like [Discoglossus pictus]
MDFRSSSNAWKWQVVYSLFLCSWGWVSGQHRYSIIEESDPGTAVGNLAQDLGLEITDLSQRKLHLGSEGSRRHFAVNQGSGALIVKDRIDRESLCGSNVNCLLHIEVIAENPLELFSLEIEIKDINDNSPTFSNFDHIIKITELFESPGVRFSLEIAQDSDVGINGIRQYILNPSPYFSLFVKNRKDGILIPELVLEKALDREEKQEHKLILTAVDGGEQPRSGSCQITIIVLDINDNAPVFAQPSYKINLLENPPLKTLVIALNATDLDEGSNSEIEYFFDQHTSDSVKDLFNLNQQSGEIFVNGEIDFEKCSFYEILIRAKDKGVPALFGRCVVQVEVEDANDNPPQIIFTSMINEVPENAVLGTAVGFFSVRDMDSDKNGEVQLKVSQNLPFEFKPFKNHYSLVTSGFLDREKTSQYTIQLIATDMGSPPLHTQTTIVLNVSDVNDNSPVFLQSHYNAFIKENNEPGSLLCSVSAFDPDVGVNSKLRYSIDESQIVGSPISSFVYINNNNGNLYSQRSFDYEHIQMQMITVL